MITVTVVQDHGSITARASSASWNSDEKTRSWEQEMRYAAESAVNDWIDMNLGHEIDALTNA